MRKIKKITIFILLVGIATIYSFYLTNLYSLDEIWNYGFAKNILDGLVPYKDFNMIVPPLFPYLVSVILKIFGQRLFVYHILIAILVASITFLAARRIGIFSILIYLALLVYSINGYNINTLFLLFILLSILEKEKYRDILLPVVISFMILSKQTLILLVIPSMIYSSHKKKTLAVYLIFFFSFLGYLIYNNNFMPFLDDCFLGMFEFTEKNSLPIPVYLMIECLICFWLLISFWKKRHQQNTVIYVLLYQIIVFPIVDVPHLVLGFSGALYIFFKESKLSQFSKYLVFIVVLCLELSTLFMNSYTTTFQIKDYLENSSSNDFLKGRLVPEITQTYILEIDERLTQYPNYQLYVLGSNSYLIKLLLDIPINKYDLINNGNMGYHGSKKYIQEIANDCQTQQCVFVLNNNDLHANNYNQTNKEILQYVDKNYHKVYASSIYNIYTNE